jgi:hypothetical protein
VLREKAQKDEDADGSSDKRGSWRDDHISIPEDKKVSGTPPHKTIQLLLLYAKGAMDGTVQQRRTSAEANHSHGSVL